ncbi:hypothetical protein EW146_g5038 [Bondarzewia mesenterica]|uniref:Uncharacterized protein n=1 Tax=Bondarzewia mesenterica TaxID=1095465 RepID=A0A4S4LYF1_9AGAM|nr:hypothetical protein EW146_g5038 [Bondarzewia mesenterica]
MAEPRTVLRSPQSPSYIPVVAPKPPTSSLPTSLSVPQLGLVPRIRQNSVTGIQSTPPHAISTATPLQSPNSGLSSFRSLRNFLPFGTGKPHSSHGTNGGTLGGSKLPLVGFGSRRSITADRKNSGTHQRAQREEETTVLDIDGSFQRHELETPSMSHSVSSSPWMQTDREIVTPRGSQDVLAGSCSARTSMTANRKTPESNSRARSGKELPVLPADAFGQQETVSEKLQSGTTSSFRLDSGPPVITYTPDPPLSTELSTIIEADMSGLSRHFPSFEESHNTADEYPLPLPDASKGGRTPDVLETSVLDLSTSKLTDEVMLALNGTESGAGWLSGVIVEDADSHAEKRARKGSGDQEPEVSFHLDALDPELAALLSPNCLTDNQQPNAEQHLSPPPLNSLAPTRENTPQTISAPLPSSARHSLVSAISHSSPVRIPATLSHSTIPRIPSSSSVPRLVRSSTDRVNPLCSEHEIASRTASDSSLPTGESRRASSDDVRPRRLHVPPSPLAAESPVQAPLVRAHTGGETYRKPPVSRLMTPSRSTLYMPASARALRATASASPSSWEADSASPSSRASSALGAAPVRRLHRPRQSIGEESRPSLGLDRDSAYASRSRKRSMSVGENLAHVSHRSVPINGKPATDLIGPRTQKAFAAAGLLDFDRENGSVNGSSSVSRFGSVRSSSDRDFRSQYAPSRLAFSEAGSASSWRSGSRNMTFSEAASVRGGPLDGFTGTPRTTFSMGSTAATSVSGASSPQYGHLSLQSMHDKHAMETGVLLSALADSQRTVQGLREENGGLLTRVQELEIKLSDAHAQIRRQQYTARSVVDRMSSRPSSSEGPSHRRLQPRVHGLSPAVVLRDISPRVSPGHSLDVGVRVEDAQSTAVSPDTTYRVQSHRRRMSNTSSVFALPPSNMTMLVQEDALSAEHSGPGSFMSLNRSVSSTGNISPTTANFSMNETMGSPRSLNLKPEHELHLGDLASLDLRFEDGEEEDGRGDDGG